MLKSSKRRKGCMENHAFMSLAIVESGRRVRLLGVQAGRELQARLATMGMVPGVEIDVISNSVHGPFIIAIKGSRIMIGRGVAGKIAVG